MTGRISVSTLARRTTATVILPLALAWSATHLLHHELYPEPRESEAWKENVFGPVRLAIKLPGTNAGIAEPLLACGKAGNATLVYIRLLPGARARVGVEFWGYAAEQSEEFSVGSSDAQIRVDCYLPALFPGPSDPYWDGIPPGLAAVRRSSYCIAVNGRVRLAGPVSYPQPPHSKLYYGANPFGGSLVSDRFSGSVLSAGQH
jgi:hypothetical protein